MRNPGISIRVLVTLALLVALVTMATPAAADPGVESALDAFFAQGPPEGITPDCNWYWPWC